MSTSTVTVTPTRTGDAGADLRHGDGDVTPTRTATPDLDRRPRRPHRAHGDAEQHGNPHRHAGPDLDGHDDPDRHGDRDPNVDHHADGRRRRSDDHEHADRDRDPHGDADRHAVADDDPLASATPVTTSTPGATCDASGAPFGLSSRVPATQCKLDGDPDTAPALEVERLFSTIGFTDPVQLTHAPDGTDRIFVVEQGGKIKVFANGSPTSATDFLTLSGITVGGEEGLLGLAFHPSYASNGFFYVYYSAPNPRRSVIARYHVSGNPNVADPASAQIVVEIAQPYANHNGGQLMFGPDGYLYISLGDGGSGGDPGIAPRTWARCSARSSASTSIARTRARLRRTARQSVRRSERRARRDLGGRHAESLAHELRPPDPRALGGRRRREHLGRSRPDRTRSKLRLAPHGRRRLLQPEHELRHRHAHRRRSRCTRTARAAP